MPTSAGAQDPRTVPEPTVQLGPVGLTPTFAIRDVGVDSNVFNDALTPARDVVAVVVPGLDASMRVGNVRLSSRTRAEWNYFQKTAGQRSVNLLQQGRALVDFTRLSPYLEAGYIRTRQRPNLEIDERVLQKTETVAAGLLVTLGPRTTLDINGQRDHVDFGDPLDGSLLLANRLNRETQAAALDVRFALTPLTTLVVSGTRRRDRFEFDAARDSDNLMVTGGVELKPSALIAGTATVGFRRLEALSPGTPDHAGVVAEAEVSYILLEQTRFSLVLNRDVEYSFETAWPYFVATTGLIEIKQAVGFVWDVVVRAGQSHLSYHAFLAPAPGPAPLPTRRDRIDTVGLGAGRHLGDDVRVGLDVNRDRRESPIAGRSYSGYRVGGSVTYGY